ncbi:Glu/Leu/Phe/Val dehydrogenase (plasmid) [Deinococcus taeanensis]|uniref:Glu/Leu/Phe/Val family dehydrogenase n=1 Tax=Deinococcus taeanensis TaxID=2737050 RepID=UPI001CDC36EC|nr:Glu/Leu/Phe/Val dehydrogenase [Deinococcus taeanensis]UBV44484.1 Glu/Leu/Phe/Val dehydrogenase [Deinococcus taeanensis]
MTLTAPTPPPRRTAPAPHTPDAAAGPLSYLDPQHPGPYAMFLDQVDRVVPYLGPLAVWAETLRRPKRILVVDVPIHLDDGSVAHFEGYRVQHNTSRGPAKGGVRYHQDVTLSEVMALSAWMTVKNAAVNLPYGGGKGGIRVDPRTLSQGELERMTRRYTSEIGLIIGPDKDIPAPDVGTGPQTMAWMMDTYSMNVGRTTTGVVTGKPVSLGGSLGRADATGRGVFVTGAEAMKKLGMSMEGARIAVQEFGNVGEAAARIFHAHGAKIVAIQDVTGTIACAAGIDPALALTHLQRTGAITGLTGTDTLQPDEFWDVACDVLIPAALEKQITLENAGRLKARLIVEGANGPTLPAADDLLADMGVTVVPDVLANAGGVTVSYFEWVQDFSSFFWSEEEINHRLDRLMREAFRSLWDVKEHYNVTLRTAVYIVACTRVLEARALRGLYP